ncbi:hypothetical protein PHET_01484 [Paragonimus heterotremus]|uniref:LIM zinc-binding domain-containing protein n=1 Tax=Paragonimus heterotremus TaxID=100268 RepID=A0A8J4T358_9TREM|nr:hypothetical protein PHET_01484 [Paragonimus heterotremus]
MPTIKPASKEAAKVIKAQANTPRRARNKSKRQKQEVEANSPRVHTNGDLRAEANGSRRSRSQSLGHRLLDAAVAHISFGRSQSKPKTRTTIRGLDISGPIIRSRNEPEVFGQSPLLIPPENLNLDNVDVPAELQPSPTTNLNITTPAGCEENFGDLGYNSGTNDPIETTPLVNHSRDSNRFFARQFSADFRPLSGEDWNDPTILDRLKLRENGPDWRCDICSETILPGEKCNLIGQIVHRTCFTCSICGDPLVNQSAICQDGVWSCAHHLQFNVNNAKDKLTTSEPEKKDAKSAPEKQGDSTPERRTSTVGVQRMGNLRDKFEKGDVGEKKKKKKTAPKIKYAGAESVKNKFIETATKASNGTANGPRGPKEFTPPPEGTAVGVLESKPQPRAPDVVTADDTLDPIDLTVIGETTKNLRAKFKHLEETGGQADEDDKPKANPLIDEFKSVGPEATRSARARWKDIESGKAEPAEPGERPKINVLAEGYGGVFENEPEKLENITRSGVDNKDLPAGISARERREEFLRKAQEAALVKKEPTKPVSVVDGQSAEGVEVECRFATEAKKAFLERQKTAEEMARSKSRPEKIDIWGEHCADSGVFENIPAARSADVVAASPSDEEEEEEEETDEE